MLRCKTDGQTLLEVLEFRNRVEIECFLPLKQRVKERAAFGKALAERLWIMCAVYLMGLKGVKKRPVSDLQAAFG